MMIDDFDWREAWKELQGDRRAADDSSYWDKRAESFSKTCGTSPYAAEFLRRSQLESGWTVLDMGCGSGTLALPLARAGHEVWACDFSPVMLELLMKAACEEGIDHLIHAQLLSWDEDWDKAEPPIPVCDVGFASRSIATADLWDSLEKLISRSRHRVCVTLSNGFSPRHDPTLWKVIGRPHPKYMDYQFAMNMLWRMGYTPEVSALNSERVTDYTSPEHALEKNAEILEPTPEERAKLEAYVAEHLHQEEDGVWHFDHKRHTCWSFISWDL